MGLTPRCAMLNDINPHVINFYRWLRRGFTISLPMMNQERPYYRQRVRFNELLAQGKARSREAGGLFYYLNRTGYNGLCRFNRSGEFNVPFGRYVRITYTRDLTPYREVFARWEFCCGDFEAIQLECQRCVRMIFWRISRPAASSSGAKEPCWR